MFDATDAVLIRAASYPDGVTLPAWPDLIDGQPEQWLAWLRKVWAVPGFAAVVTQATPSLADQVTRALSGRPPARRPLRRVVVATMRYLLRWTTRATPFGRLAGVAAGRLGARTEVRWGDAHREVARPDGRFIAVHAERAERDVTVLRSAMVVTNALGYRRGDVWVLPCARTDRDRVWDVEIDLTEPVRLAVQAAAAPIAFTTLTDNLATALSVNVTVAELLAELVQAGVLLSQVRPSLTVTDPAAHLARYIDLPDPGHQVAVDLHLDCSVTLPPAVAREACHAASALVRVAPCLAGWAGYHRAFIERWGPGAAVPLREVVRVLGFPAGYRGSWQRDQQLFTARDALLIELAQRSVMNGCAEVVLDDDLIERLRGDDDRPPIPHTELRFVVAAATPRDLDRGAFTLTVVSGARHAAVAASRFLHLLTPPELARFRQVYAQLPTAMAGADTVQVSGPPLDARLSSVARTPELYPILPAGEFHPDPQWTIADLAVTGDGQRLWLLSQTTGRPVEPLLVNCVLLPTGQHPLIRFLTEIWSAFTAPCTPFDWGHARVLPFLPRVRRGRSILHPARWAIDAEMLPPATETWRRWRVAWQRLREQQRLPQEVLLGDGDQRIRLDLDEPAHVALVRDHLDRHQRAVLTEAPGPAGWIGGRPAELLLTLTRSRSYEPQRPRPARPANPVQCWPGHSRWLDARLVGRTEHVLAHLARTGLPAGAWFLRYPDPQPHLRLRVPLRPAGRFADAAHELAQLAQRLHENGLLTDYALATYRPETRHGTGATLAAAEAVFAADSRAVLSRLSGDRQAATAAGMLFIADAFTGDGAAWLFTHVGHRSGPRISRDQLSEARRPWEDAALEAALKAYRRWVDHEGLDANQVLADLLHLHHARMVGVDTASERHCLRLARAVARTRLLHQAP